MRPFAFLCFLSIGIAQLLSAQQYPILPVPGAPKNITTLFQDSTGRLWVGGDELAVFDGTRFFFLRDYGMPAGAIYSIAEDPGGVIWVGSGTGIYRFANGTVQAIATGFAVTVIPASSDLLIAAVGPAGGGLPATLDLMRFTRKGEKWIAEKVSSLGAPGPLSLDHDGMVLFAGPRTGWSEFRLEDAVKFGARPDPLPITHHAEKDAFAGPVRVSRDQFGCVWYGTDSQARFKCGGDDWTFAPSENSGAGPSVFEASDGSMLLAGQTFLAVGRPGSFRTAGSANGLPVTSSAIQARDGTIWLGGPEGLYRFAFPFRLEYWTTREGIKAPWSIARVGADMFAGLDKSIGKLTLDRRQWKTLTAYRESGKVMSLLAAGNGLVVAANPGGAAVLNLDGSLRSRAPQEPLSDYDLRLAQTAEGQIWVGGLNLWQFKPQGKAGVFERHVLDTVPTGNILDVQYEPATQKLWACYNNGLVVRDKDNRWREFTVKDGLIHNPCWSLAALPNGDVWYAYYNEPAFARLRPNSREGFDVRQFRASDGVPDPESLNFDTDQRGWLWRGGNHGLSVSDSTNAEAGRWIFFDQSDGLSGEGVNSGSYFADKDGSIWMGIDLSIMHFLPPADLLTPLASPGVFVSSIALSGATPRLAGLDPEFPRGSNLVAHLGTLQFDRRHALRYRFRMLPGDSQWHESNELDLALGKLSFGTHTLEIQGRIFTGPWSSSVRQSFHVLRPFWLAWPFVLACFAGAALSTSGAFWIRSRRKADRAELLPNLARWRMGALLPEVLDLEGTPLAGRFEVGELLARGGFANVMNGFDLEQKQRCAVKVFRDEIKDKAWIHRTFQQEVAALGKVRHPNVVSIYAHGITPSGSPYLVMEFIEGRSLREILEAGPLTPLRTARALRQLGGALEAIHGQGICHRDVKPENIIVRGEVPESEESVLIDFSIAIVKDANETLYGLSRAAGTFDYMGPEQAIGYAEPSSDIYSLAKVAIEMLTGQRLKTLLPDAALDLPERVRELLRGMPLKFSADSIEMLASALEFDPSRRPSVAGQFAAPLVRDLELQTQVGNRPEQLL